ncbi:MAG: MSMEG_0565 family glycosyltransferase [Myxococcota bacterium]
MTSIGLFTYSTKPRGSVVHAAALADALSERGHDVTLYALSKAGDRMYRELACPVVYFPAAEAPADPDALIAQRIREVAAGVLQIRTKHELFHAEDCLVASGLLAVRQRLGGAPIVRTLHHLEHFASAYLRECQRRSILEADEVFCVSRVSQRDVLRELGRNSAIIGNGVDVEHFAYDRALESWGRARFGCTPEQIVVLSVGGIEPRKNSLRALDAMLPLLAERSTLRWLIVGGASIWEHDRYRAEFRERVATLPLDRKSRIIELGSVSERELTALYGICQVLLCPSLQEGFGLCVLEAMAAGAAVVVSEREPFTEYLSHHSACFVDPESAASIGCALAALLDDGKRRTDLAQAGRQKSREFSWRRVAQAHERHYRELTARAPAPSFAAW